MTKTRYVIMANGQGSRWDGYLGTSKHLLKLFGETLLERIVRQVSEHDAGAEIIISASNPQYDTPGATRHVPLRNDIELDRFVPELINDNVCFLYGDTYYEDSAVKAIVSGRHEGLHFYGDERAIIAVKSASATVLLQHLQGVRELYLTGKIDQCIGWQLYQSYAGLPFGPKAIGEHFTVLQDEASGFNAPEDYEAFIAEYASRIPEIGAAGQFEPMGAV